MEAFEDIVKDHSQRIYYFLRGMGLEHNVADEVLEDVFVSYWRDLKSGHGLDAVALRLFQHATKKILAEISRSEPELLFRTEFRSKLVLLLKHHGFDSPDIAELTGMGIDQVRESYRVSWRPGTEKEDPV